MSERIYLNDNWYFTRNYSSQLLEPDYDISSLEKVRLPHTVCETPFHYFDESSYQMLSGYRLSFLAEPAWQNKHVLLTFEGAAHHATVYINGKLMTTHACGYTAFTIDLSSVLHYGKENTIVVALDSSETLNQPPFGNAIDYMTYGGLYREVYLDVKESYYIEDAFVTTTEVLEETKHLNLFVTVNYYKAGLFVRSNLKRNDEVISFPDMPLDGTSKHITYSIGGITLWDTENPALYTLEIQLINGDMLFDTYTIRFGFREALFKADGFYLNGKKLLLRGLNRHQSYPYVGYAMPKAPQRYDADLLKKELGLNAVRTSHYPQSHYFIDRCDELGLLVFTEIPGWQHIGDKAWQDIACQNVREMVLQYRNHPSIILWGVRINESPDNDAFYKETNRIAHELDPSRSTGGVRCIKNSHLFEDVYTYNDFSHYGNNSGLEKRHKVFHQKEAAYLVSEYNGHMYPTKSFDDENHRLTHALRHANVLDAAQNMDHLSGTFGWCMFDYNTHKDFGSGDRMCHHGVMDMFRNQKLAAANYSCFQEKTPVLTVSSSMDVGEHPASFMEDIYIFTNADSVRFYKNDVFIKEYTKADSPYKHLPHGPILIDDLIGDQLERIEGYPHKTAEAVKSVLMATSRFGVAKLPLRIKLTVLKLMLFHSFKIEDGTRLYTKYIGNWGGISHSYRFEAIKDGKVVKTVIKNACSQPQLFAEADHLTLHEETTYDVASIRIRALDEYHNQLPYYQEPITLTLTGEAELIGPSIITLKGGMGGTYIKTMGKSGTATLIISGEGISETTLNFTIR